MNKYFSALMILLMIMPIAAQQYNPGPGTLNSTVSVSKSAEEQNIINELIASRKRGDLSATLRYQGILDIMYGSISHQQNYSADILSSPSKNNPGVDPVNDHPDYQVSSIAGVNCKAISIASTLYSRSIFAAVTKNNADSTSEISVYVSYDGGIGWILRSTRFISSTYKFRQGELDILPLVSGSDTILFCAAGAENTLNSSVFYFQFNIMNGQSTPPYPFRTYSNSTGVNYYNPKFSTDQFMFPAAPYVHMTVAYDSAGVKAGTRIGVFHSPLGIGDQPVFMLPNRGGSFWWNSNGQAPAYIYHDVCFQQDDVNNQGKVYTVYNLEGSQNIYVAWSADWGVSVDSANTYVVTESSNISGVCCEGNNFLNNKLAIGYRKSIGNQWDYRLLYSTNGGGSFAQYIIENSAEACTSISMQSVDSGDGRFVLAYSTGDNKHWYRKFNKGNISIPMLINTSPGSTGFGGVQAGVWNSPNPDSCVVVWLTQDSSRAKCTSLICSAPVGIDPVSGIPSEFSLWQNYPNPFNPVTKIKFSVPAAGYVKLAVYDITGKEVTVLINSSLTAGVYTADLNASLLSSGVYFYKITAGNFHATKKMVLVK